MWGGIEHGGVQTKTLKNNQFHREKRSLARAEERVHRLQAVVLSLSPCFSLSSYFFGK